MASKSPRRRALREQRGVRDFRTVPPDIDEHMDRDLPPAELVRQISLEKAQAVAAQADSNTVVIAADTVVALDGVVLGKPAGKEEAFRMLSLLSGNRHKVYTGLTVLRGEQVFSKWEETAGTFRSLTAEEIEAYIATGGPMDQAGA